MSAGAFLVRVVSLTAKRTKSKSINTGVVPLKKQLRMQLAF